MRRFLALLLAFVMAFTLAGCTSKAPSAEATGTITVGTPAINGDFIYDFGNSSYDKYVKDLTSGFHYYALYYVSPGGDLPLNEVVVKDCKTSTDDAGNVTYTYTLHKDLKWNDGTTITAKDYVFSMLFRTSKEWADAGAVISFGDALLGYEAYHDGETDVFAAVKLIGDYEFSFTIDGVNLPYYYEPTFTDIFPVCSAVWAPGCSIENTDGGARITGVDLAACAETVANVERYAPTVTCGPYSFVSFEDQIVTLEANTYFKEDPNGYGKPKAKNIVIKNINQDTNVDQVINGEVDLVTGIIEGAKIDAAKASPNTDFQVFSRNGFGQLAFACDWGPTADINVRWAISSLIDRRDIVDYVCGGYAVTVDAEYSLAQWMYQERKEQLLAAIKPISFNLDTANNYLDQTEWKYESDGKTPFDSSKANSAGSYLRYNSSGEMLVIEHMGTSENAVTDSVEIQYTTNAPLAGMKVNVSKVEFNELLQNYYYGYELGADRKYHSFNLGLGFSEVYDPYYASYHSDYAGTYANSDQIVDAELDRTIEELRSTEPGDTETFADRWVAFQVRFNELMPCVPLYANEYYDIYNVRMQGLSTTSFLSWAQSVCTLSLAG